MSQQYDEYLHEHVSNVNRAAEWMIDHNMVPDYLIDILRRKLVPFHDESKYDSREYNAYDEYFYGKGKDDIPTKLAFNYAWLRHIHLNPHHWQYWVLINDEDGVFALEMPKQYVYEMIADWWSFSWKQNDLTIIFNWYSEHSKNMILHPNTKALVEEILDEIKTILNT